MAAAAAAALQSIVTLKSSTSTSISTSTRVSAALTSVSVSSSSSATFNPLRLTILSRTSNSSRGALGARMYDTCAGRYATALADVANSTGTLPATSDDVAKIEKIFTDADVYSFFSSPVIGTIEKRSVLDEIVESAQLQPHTANFLNILVDMNRIELVKDIVKEFERVYNLITETEMAVVTSVVNLDNDHLAQIAKGVQKLTGAKNVRIKTLIDPTLVAGFTVRYGNGASKLVDFSVKTQLTEIADQLDLSDIQLAAA
ncbi:ATP synthase delta chain, chloroplastic [Silene latifolia]|uniref:ATP synthase delta chain, chloroplastic n=1 Tax=Silene latifolia TaxID=37657 RepID=UPI003D76ACBD